MRNKIKRPTTKQPGAKVKNQLHDNTSIAQRERLLERLREKPITTIQARHELNILAPAPRVHELRHDFGYNIQKTWVTDISPEGLLHRVARYVLLSGKWEDKK